MPDIASLLADLAATLGGWTYLLVAGLAFLETGAFVGLVAPGETAVVLGGVVAAQGEISLVAILLTAWVASLAGDVASFALAHAAVPSTEYGRNARIRNPEAPAMNGETARMIPTKRPTRIALPPWRS